MLSFPAAVNVFICTRPTDMRKSFDTLAALTRDVLYQDPMSGHIFVFFNKRRNRMKLLYWDKFGFCLFIKRLEQGRFHVYNWDNTTHASYVTEPRQLNLILDGIDISMARKRKRFGLRFHGHGFVGQAGGAVLPRILRSLLLPAIVCLRRGLSLVRGSAAQQHRRLPGRLEGVVVSGGSLSGAVAGCAHHVPGGQRVLPLAGAAVV